MVELAEAKVLNKKMLKKLKRHHGHRHGGDHDHHHGGDEVLCGALAPDGSEIVVVLRGKHYHHHHHHHHAGPVGATFHDGDEEGQFQSKHRHGRGRHGRVGHRVIECLHGLKHHVRRHHHRCRGLGLYLHHHHYQQGTEAGTPVTPTAPQAELMMRNLSLAEDKEANKP